MNRVVKKLLWTIASLTFVILAVIAVAVNIIFSKDKLTPIVRDQLPNYITCQSELGEVELTFFSTFPHFALRLSNFSIVNPVEGAQSDTLLRVNSLDATIDVEQLLKTKQLDFKKLELKEGMANLFMASDSTSNYDVFIKSSEEKKSSFLTDLDVISVKDIDLTDVYLSYINLIADRKVSVKGLNAQLKGESSLKQLSGKIELALNIGSFIYTDANADLLVHDVVFPRCQFALQDSLNLNMQTAISASTMNLGILGSCPVQIDAGNLDITSLYASVTDKKLTDSSINVDISTLNMRIESDNQVTIQLSDAGLSLPQVHIGDMLQTQFFSTIGDANLQTKREGSIAQHLPLSTSGDLKAKPDFSKIQLRNTGVDVAEEHADITFDWVKLGKKNYQLIAESSLMPTTCHRLMSLVPEFVQKKIANQNFEGNIKTLTGNVNMTFTHEKPMTLNSFEVSSSVDHLHYQLADTLLAAARAMEIEAEYPFENVKFSQEKTQQQIKKQVATNNNRRSKHVVGASFMRAKVSGEALHFEKHDSSNVIVDMPLSMFDCVLSDEVLQDSLSLPFLAVDFTTSQLTAKIDTISVNSHDMKGSFSMADGVRRTKKYYEAKFSSSDTDLKVGKMASVVSGPMDLEASSVYDFGQKDLLLRYNPALNINMKNGEVELAQAPYPFHIPSIDFDFDLSRLQIRDSQLKYGDSDFKLTGDVKNLREYLKKESDLKAELRLRSYQTDVYQLMDLVESFATKDTLSEKSDAEKYITATLQEHQNNEVETADARGGDPFMVPLSIDLALSTNISKTLVGENVFENLGGKLYIKDGNLVLDEMGFSSKAARMQLTALYRTPKKNNLFVGANFHLLDIEVADLIKMIPAIDSIVPMLRSFEGKGEFHLAAETNMFSDYALKMSTLKATANVEGKDLVLLDGKTFSTISKYLLFNKKTRNQIDTLSVEMAVNRNRMTVFPMLIGMDKYQAVLSGTHELVDDMPFNYHVSITDCPLVGGRLGLDIAGDMTHPEGFSFKLVGCKYASLYKPKKRNVSQSQTLELKSLVSKALKRTVREQQSFADL